MLKTAAIGSGTVLATRGRMVVKRTGLHLVLLLGLACARSATVGSAPGQTSSPALPSAPWRGATLAAGEVPAVYGAEWRKAENRSTCALVAPRSLGAGTGATPRAATFSGGWAVAYDREGLRSAFGVAGTGAIAKDAVYHQWPHKLRWADSSTAGYGPEGGTGPNQLAYLTIAGQRCLYNVWSRLGVEHLEYLLGQLRFVTP